MLKAISIHFGKIAPHLTELSCIQNNPLFILNTLVSLGTSSLCPLETLSFTCLSPIHLKQYNSLAFLVLHTNHSLLEVHLAGMDA